MYTKFLFFLSVLFFPQLFIAQSELLDEINYDVRQEVIASFKGLKVVNFESTKLVSEKEFTFSVSHRFGSIKYGFDNFFGLDEAVTRLNFIYGLNSFTNVSFYFEFQ